jgi:hypothetical protein
VSRENPPPPPEDTTATIDATAGASRTPRCTGMAIKALFL